MAYCRYNLMQFKHISFSCFSCWKKIKKRVDFRRNKIIQFHVNYTNNFVLGHATTCRLTHFKLPNPASTYKSNSHCCFKCIAITQQDPPPPQKKMAGKKHIHKKSWRILKHISQGLNQVSKWRLKLALKSAETISLEKAFCLGISV
jgi:hypothetical protein